MRKQRGFTLVEAMIVVAIIGVLASIGYSVLQKMLWQARASEVSAIFDSIIAKEEAHFAEFHRYMPNGFVPAAPDPKGAQMWPDTGNASIAGFDAIGFRPDTNQVWHSFRVIACTNAMLPPCNAGPCATDFPTGYNGAGFIIIARGNVNGDNFVGMYCATSHKTTAVITTDATCTQPAGYCEDWLGQDSL